MLFGTLRAHHASTTISSRSGKVKYQLFSDLEQNFSIQFIEDDGTMGGVISEHPKTKKKMTRNEAVELAEAISNPQPPKTKLEFFERMTDEDYGNYLEALPVVSGRFANIDNAGELAASIKAQKILLTKFELRPDFDFSDQDLKTLTALCKEFNISVIQSV